MIAVIGATGNTGRATVKELRALGENPLCVVRNADKAKDVLAPMRGSRWPRSMTARHLRPR